MMRAGWGLVAVLAILVAAGCEQQAQSGAKELRSVSRTPPRPVDRVDKIELFAAPPAAINWDNVPGVDGVQVRILMYQVDRPEPILVKGTVEFLMYGGRLEQESASTPTPLKVWRFTPQEMEMRRFRGIAGWGYALQLGWGRDVPQAKVVSLSARYLPSSGAGVSSAPILIAVASPARTGPVRSILGEPSGEGAASRLKDGMAAAARPMRFRRETIDPDPPGAQHDVTLLADVNRDGRLDILIGCKRGSANLFWYENPSWKRHDMASAPNLEAGGLVLDVNGDGRPDVVAGQQLGGRELYWFECPADPAGPWTKHLIENRFEQYHDQAAGDVDGDGKIEIAVLSQRSGVLVYYDIPPDPTVSPWPKESCHEVGTGLQDVEGLLVVDLDGDKRPEIVAGTTIFRRSAKDGTWKGEPFAPAFTKTRVAAADLDGDGRLEIVLSEGESAKGRLVWCKPPSWTPHPLREDLFHPHSLAIADFDGDGLPDILVAEMGLGQNKNPRMFIYRNCGRGRFEEVLISQGVPTHEAKVGDVNGDGRPDIVGKPYEPERHVDVWFNEAAKEP